MATIFLFPAASYALLEYSSCFTSRKILCHVIIKVLLSTNIQSSIYCAQLQAQVFSQYATLYFDYFERIHWQKSFFSSTLDQLPATTSWWYQPTYGWQI